MTTLITGLLVVTGATGLLYQVVLGRLFALNLGSSGASHAVTLAAFLGGLSLGSLGVARLTRTRPGWFARPFVVYAGLEAAIGLWMAIFPTTSDAVFGLTQSISEGVDPTSWTASALKLSAAAVLVLPLSAALGATLPVLAVGVARLVPGRAGLVISRLYAVNAAGAAIGAYITGFWLIEAFGLELPLMMGAALNVGVGVVMFAAARGLTSDPAPQPAEPLAANGADSRKALASPGGLSLKVSVVAALLTGVVSLLYEIVWTRLSGLVLGASVYAFAMMLVVVIAGIAIGSGIATRVISAGAAPATVFATCQAAGGVFAALLVVGLDELPLGAFELRALFATRAEAYDLWVAVGGGWVMLHFLPCAIALGASFPALLTAAEVGGTHPEKATAWILGSNTFGNLLGALAGSFILMPAIGLENVLALGAVASVLVSALAAGAVRRRWIWPVAGAALVGLIFASGWPEMQLLYQGLFRLKIEPDQAPRSQILERRYSKVVFRQDGTDASISIHRPGELIAFRTNGKPDGSVGPKGEGDQITQIMLGHLGFIHAPQAKRVFIVGFGTGQTAAAAASHPGTDVTAAELNEGVLTAAPYFAEYTDDVLARANVHVLLTDAREALRAAAPGSLDMYISEPSNPWVVGVGDLYTRDHLERVKTRLAPGGVVVQWIHAYELGDELLREIVCTAHGVFPRLFVYRLGVGDFALVAAQASESDPMAIDEAAVQRWLTDPSVVASIPKEAPMFPADLDQLLLMNMSGPATSETLCRGFDRPLEERFPRLEYAAPRYVFARKQATDTVRALDGRTKRPFDSLATRRLLGAPRSPDQLALIRAFLVAETHDFETPLIVAATPRDRLPEPLARLIATAPDPAVVSPPDVRSFCADIRQTAPWMFVETQTVLGPPLPELAAWPALCARP